MPKKKILIVDDNDEIRGIYADVFRQKGYEVLEARDGVEGADMAASEEDLAAVFTGVVMPRMDGFQMLEVLRQNPLLAKLPAFINSHFGREEDRRKAEMMKLDGFFVRGTISPAEVCEKITERIRGEEEKKYLLGLSPWDLQGEVFIEENGLPADLKCLNCGTDLAIELVTSGKKIKTAQIKCPNCGQTH